MVGKSVTMEVGDIIRVMVPGREEFLYLILSIDSDRHRVELRCCYDNHDEYWVPLPLLQNDDIAVYKLVKE